jgi:hypothetical protein
VRPYYTYVVFAALVAFLTFKLSRGHTGRFVGVWGGISIALGILGIAVTWSSRDGSLTGQGAPIPIEIIEHYVDGGSADFPWPAALLLSPLAIFAGGLICGLMAAGLRHLWMRYVYTQRHSG